MQCFVLSSFMFSLWSHILHSNLLHCQYKLSQIIQGPNRLICLDTSATTAVSKTESIVHFLIQWNLEEFPRRSMWLWKTVREQELIETIARGALAHQAATADRKLFTTRMEQALGGILECSYLWHSINLVQDSTGSMMSGNADVFARMSYCKNLLVNRMFTEAGNHESYIQDTLMYFDGRNKTFTKK